MKRLLVFFGLVVGLLTTQTADAAFQLRYSTDGGTTFTVVTDNVGADDNATAGVISVSFSGGVFDIVISSSLSKPALPNTASSARMKLSVDGEFSGAGDALIVDASDDGFALVPSPGDYILKSSFTGSVSNATATSSTYVDLGNAVFGIPGTVSVGPLAPGQSDSVAFAGTSPFSMDLRTIITPTGAGDFSTDVTSSVSTPAPAGIVLAGTGILGLVGFRMRRKKIIA